MPMQSTTGGAWRVTRVRDGSAAKESLLVQRPLRCAALRCSTPIGRPGAGWRSRSLPMAGAPAPSAALSACGTGALPGRARDDAFARDAGAVSARRQAAHRGTHGRYGLRLPGGA